MKYSFTPVRGGKSQRTYKNNVYPQPKNLMKKIQLTIPVYQNENLGVLYHPM